MTDIEKLEKLQSYLKVSWKELASKLGLKTAQTFTDIRAGKHGISSRVAAAILKTFPQINRDWLVFGTGDMLKADVEKSVAFFDTFDALSSNAVSSFNITRVFPKAEYAVRNTDNSMVELPVGAIVFLKEVKDDYSHLLGSICLIETSEFSAIKRIQGGVSNDEFTLYSTNDKRYSDGKLMYEPISIKKDAVKRIFSVVGYAFQLANDVASV